MAAETKLDSTGSTTTDNAPTLYTEHEEYRYDALGRRIWSPAPAAASARCRRWCRVTGCEAPPS
ncbi:MAG TPA: hypothetical protein VF118_17415 [Gemmatimonadaceae bacterium]